MGQGTKASGVGSVAMGFATTASGLEGVAMGAQTTASGWYSTAMGRFSSAGGLASTAMGQEAYALGDNSVAFGLGDPADANRPQITGDRSFGIFMGAQDSVDVTAANTMGLFGGRMVIDPAVPATQLSVSSGDQLLELDVEGDIGAINYCDELGNNCFTAAAVSSGSVPAPGIDRQIPEQNCYQRLLL